MSSTNKTRNVLLSQFLGTDHFSFLTDYNGDMLKIDTYCGNLKALIDGTNGKAEQNTESIQNIQSDIQSIQTVQERQNTNITTNTEDITNLKSGLTFTRKLVDKNTENIKALQSGLGNAIALPAVVSRSNIGEANINFYYDPTTKNIYATSNTITAIEPNPNAALSARYKLDVSKIKNSEVVARLQKGRPITVNCGWYSSTINLTIDGLTETVPVFIPLSMLVYGDGTSNTINVDIDAAQRTPTGGMEQSGGTLSIEATIPMTINI